MNGDIIITVYKSTRKNSKTETIIWPLTYDHSTEKGVNLICDVVENIIATTQKLRSKSLIVSSSIIATLENTMYINANKQPHSNHEIVHFFGNQQQFYSIEQVFDLIYCLYCFLTPDTELSRYNLCNDTRYKAIVHNWYHG